MKISSGCRECGHNLYDAILKAWPATQDWIIVCKHCGVQLEASWSEKK